MSDSKILDLQTQANDMAESYRKAWREAGKPRSGALARLNIQMDTLENLLREIRQSATEAEVASLGLDAFFWGQK